MMKMSQSPASTASHPRRCANYSRRLLRLATAVAMSLPGMLHAASVTLTTSDASNTSSFNAPGNWDNAQAPSSGNDYFVGSGLFLRTPTNQAQTYTFLGDSVTLAGTIGFKMTNLITVPDLRLTNGVIQNLFAGGNPNMGRLAGAINVITNGAIDAGGTIANGSTLTHMRIQSTISGNGSLSIRKPSVVTFTAASSFTGPLRLEGTTLELEGTASLAPSSLTMVSYALAGTITNTAVTNIVRPGGSLNVGSGPDGVLRIGYRTGSAISSSAHFDVSSQSQFTANVGEFSAGINANSGGTGTSTASVLLASNNTVIATNILVADSIGASGGSSSMTLGGGSNYFNTPVMTLGARKQNAQLTLPAGGVFRLDNGAGRTDLGICVQDFNTSANPASTMNLSNGTFIASLGAVTIGQKTLANSGSANGTLLIGSSAANNVDANSIMLGNLAGADSGTPAVAGTLSFGGGTFRVNGNVTLANYDYGIGSSAGTLNINGGTFSVAGDIVDGGGTSTLNVNGGVLDMQPSGDGTPGNVTVDVLAGSGRITNSSVITASTSVSPGTTNTVGTLTVGAIDLTSGATLNFNLNGDQTIGNGTNDLLQVNGNIALFGNMVRITALTPLTAGTYRLINCTGTIQGADTLTLVAPQTRQTFQLSYTGNQLNLVVTGNPTSLVWSGDNSGNVWDEGSSPNWNSQTDVFYGGDNVIFNDSGSVTPDIYISSQVTPGSMVVSNVSKAYTFTGMGISTAGSFVKRGANTVSLANDGNNFTGPVTIEAGTLSIGNGGATGNWSGNVAITNNAQLQANKSSGGFSINGPISGTGAVRVTGGGAALNLAGSNSYSGLTIIEPGCQLSVFNNSGLGDTNTGTVVQSGGRVGFTTLGNWTVAEPLEITGYGIGTGPGALYANTTSNRVTWTGPISVAGDAQIRLVNNAVRMTLANTVIGNQTALQCSAQDTGSMLTFQNTLSLGNAAALTKDGVGTMVLGGSSNLCGSTMINGGTLLVTTPTTPHIGNVTVNSGTLQIGDGGANGALPNGSVNLAGTGTTLIVNSSNNVTLSQELSGAGNLSKLNAGTLIITSSNSFTGNVTTGSGAPVVGGPISLFNSHGLGDGLNPKTVTLTRAELQLQGGLTIPAAISFVTSGGALANSPGGELIPIRSMTGNNTVEGTITLGGGGADTVIASDSGTLTLNGEVMPGTAAASRILYLGGAGNGVLNGTFSDFTTNDTTYVGILTKQGAGTWTLNAANTYSGATTIQNGTLALGAGGSLANSPTIQLLSNAVLNVSAVSGGFTVGASQTLKGNGTVQGNASVAGVIAPGTSVGTLNFSANLALSGATVMELNRTNVQNADLIAAAAVAFGGDLTVTNIGEDLQAGDTFNLFDGAITGQFTSTNLPALSSTNLHWDFSQFSSQGILKVASNVAPQPTILPPTRSGNNLLVQVVSEPGFDYVLEATPQLAPASWTAIQTNAGGGTLTFTIPIGPAPAKQFFRIQVK